MPLDIHVLRQRYNGQTFKSTYAVGRDMHISDETVRTIENRALDAIAHCLDLEAAGQAITPMRLAKSFRQPMASAICNGSRHTTSSAVYTAHRGELIIYASRFIDKPRHPFTPFACELADGLPLGAIIGRCLLVDCFRSPLPNPESHKWLIVLDRPETFLEPIPYAGQSSFFHIDNDVAKQLPPRYQYSF